MTAAKARIAVVTVTFPDLASVEQVGHRLVEERLAACCNVAPCRSTYRWRDQVEAADEMVVSIKTSPAKVAILVERLAALHPYELPAIEWTEVDASVVTRDWIEDATRD